MLPHDPRHLFDANIFYPHDDTLAFRRSCPTETPLLRPGEVQIPAMVAIRASLPPPPATPTVVRRQPALLDVPVLAQVEAAPVGSELERDGVQAVPQAGRARAVGEDVPEVAAALLAEDLPGMKGIGDDGGSAITASGAEVMQTFEVSTFALPVTNGVIHKLKL